MSQTIKKSSSIFLAIAISVLSAFGPIAQASAIAGYALSMSPMNEKILLNPGDSYDSAITLAAPSEYESPVKYTLGVSSYFINDDGGTTYEACNEYCELEKWITINSPEVGKLEPGEQTKVFFNINVPKDTIGGGQYAAITAKIEKWTENDNSNQDKKDSSKINSALTETMLITHIIYAEVTGDIIRQGEVMSASIPGFLLDGNISGISSIKNTGNVHSDATYKLQVFPLFSNEEIYTNEENPQTRTILPSRTLTNATSWEKTPGIGIFNVVYTAEFEGVITKVEKMVIICPIWLLFIIVFGIMFIIFYLGAKSKNRKNRRQK